MMVILVNGQSRWPACIVLMRHVWLFVLLIVSIRPMTVWYCTQRICVSAADTASMHVHLARHSSLKQATLAAAAKWTNVHSVQAAQKKTIQQRNLQNTVATVLLKANCQSVQKCVLPKHFSLGMVMLWLRSIANALLHVVSALVLGAGAQPMNKKAVNLLTAKAAGTPCRFCNVLLFTIQLRKQRRARETCVFCIAYSWYYCCVAQWLHKTWM